MSKINIRKIFTRAKEKKEAPPSPVSEIPKPDNSAQESTIPSVEVKTEAPKLDKAQIKAQKEAIRIAKEKKKADEKAARQAQAIETKEQKLKGKRGGRLPMFSRLSTKERVHFIKRLSFLIRSGVPVLEGLHILRSQFRSKSKAAILERVIADIANGQSLALGFSRFRAMFGDFAINVVKVGEMSGNLSENLSYLAEELKKRQVLKQKVVSALVYPLFITVATIGIATLLTVYIFPKIMPIFASLKVNLPITTKVLIFLSAFLIQYGLYVLGGLIVLAIAFVIALKKIPSFHYFVARMILRAPLLGTLVQSYNVTNFCRTFSLLLQSGFNVVEATTVLADSTPNPVYKLQCKKLEEQIVKGERISAYLATQRALFPDMVTHMILIGETSGNLVETLKYLSEHFESELDDLIKNLSSSIEPVLMIVMGLIVGFVAVSVITPIYEITQNLSH